MKALSLLLTLLAGPAFGAEAIETNTSSRFDWSRIARSVKANYSILFLGPTLHRPNGDIDGKGHYMNLRNYFSLSTEPLANWVTEAGGEFRQYWRALDPKKPNRADQEMRDPYVGIARKNIVGGEIFSLGARARYFLPVTKHNVSKRGTPEDAGRGELNAGLTPYWRLMDGALSFSCAIDAYYKFDKNGPAHHERYALRAKPQATYRFHRKVAGRVEYSTGVLRHQDTGHWTKFNDRITGQRVMVGVLWYPTQYLSLNPGLAWGSHTFRLNRAEVSLYASLSML